jgi:hypothetical protein
LLVEELGELVGAFEGGEDEGRPLVLGLGVGVEALQDEVAEGVHVITPSVTPSRG